MVSMPLWQWICIEKWSQSVKVHKIMTVSLLFIDESFKVDETKLYKVSLKLKKNHSAKCKVW